jgi:NAD(P) transhydrogenase subunit beta
VVNPVARTDKSSPIYGMPILNADKAEERDRRSSAARARGFSGIENALFFLDNTRMLYGDGQKRQAEPRQCHQGGGLKRVGAGWGKWGERDI